MITKPNDSTDTERIINGVKVEVILLLHFKREVRK